MKTSLTDQLHNALMDKEHIIWDWNGTLLDDVSYEHQCPSRLRSHHEVVIEI